MRRRFFTFGIERPRWSLRLALGRRLIAIANLFTGRASPLDCIPATLVASLLTSKYYEGNVLRYVRIGHDTFEIDQDLGPNLYSDLRDTIAEIYVTRRYERYGVRLFPGSVVLDCGAHVGVYTMWAIHRVGASGKVIAFEPELKNFQLLLRNLEINKVSNVMPVNMGVSNSVGKLPLIVAPNSWSHYIPDRESTYPEGRCVEIACDTIDNIVFNRLGLGRVDLIKMDIEGHELQALEGAREVLQTFAPSLVICAYHYNGRDRESIIRFISSLLCQYHIELDVFQEIVYAWADSKSIAQLGCNVWGPHREVSSL